MAASAHTKMAPAERALSCGGRAAVTGTSALVWWLQGSGRALDAFPHTEVAAARAPGRTVEERPPSGAWWGLVREGTLSPRCHRSQQLAPGCAWYQQRQRVARHL